MCLRWMRRQTTYNREINVTSRQEVVVKTRKIWAPACLEAETCVNFQDNDVSAINNVEDFLLLLGHLLLKSVEMLNDLGRTREGCGCSNVVQRCGISQQRRAGRS